MLPDRTLHLRVANAELRAKWVAAVGSAVRDIRRVATRPRAMTGGVGMEGRVRRSPAPVRSMHPLTAVLPPQQATHFTASELEHAGWLLHYAGFRSGWHQRWVEVQRGHLCVYASVQVRKQTPTNGPTVNSGPQQ